MVAIQVNDQVLDLGGKGLPFRFHNPFVGTELYQGDYTLPFSIPNTPHNNKVLGFPSQISNVNQFLGEYDCVITYNGLQFRKGVLNVLSVGKTIKCSLHTAFGALMQKLRNTKLNEIEYGGIYTEIELRPFIEFEVNNTDNLNIDYVDTDYYDLVAAGSPVYHSITITNNFATNGDIDLSVQQMVDAINAQNLPFYAEYLGLNSMKIIHTLYVGGGLNDEFDTTVTFASSHYVNLNQRLNSDGFPDQTLHFRNTVSRFDDGTYPYVFAPFKNEKISESNTALKYANYYYNNDFDIYANGTVVPLFRLNFILEKIAEFAGFKLVGGILDEDDFKRLLVWNNYALETFFLTNNPDDGRLNGPITIDPKNHMPEVNIPSFLLNLKKYLGITFTVLPNTNELSVRRISEFLTTLDAVDITDKSGEIISIAPKPNLSGLKFAFKKDSTDAYFSDNLVDLTQYVIATEVETFSDLPTGANSYDRNQIVLVKDTSIVYEITAVTPSMTYTFLGFFVDHYGVDQETFEIQHEFVQTIMQTETDERNTSRDWLIPRIDVPFTYLTANDQYEDGKNPFELRLLSYFGLQEDSQGDDYPLLSSYNKDYSGTQLSNFTLRYHGTYGLFNVMLDKWAEYLQNYKQVELTIQFSIQDIFDLSEKGILFNTIGRYAWEKISVTLGQTIQPAKSKINHF